MNNTPVFRFSGFKGDWEPYTLGELAEIVRGASPRPIQDPIWFDEGSDVGWLRISDVTEQGGRICHLEQKISKVGQAKTRVLTTPHLLLSIAATVGKPVINYVKIGVHDGFLIFLNPQFDQEFMFQWLENFRTNWQQYGQPGSQVNLNSDLVKMQEIKLPSNKEQAAIGNFFYTFDKNIILNKCKLNGLKQLKEGYLQQMLPHEGKSMPRVRLAGFTGPWKLRKLGDIAIVEMCRRVFKEQTSSVGDVPFYKIGTFGGNPDAFISRDLYEEYKEKYPYPEIGDILISASGSIGRVVEYGGQDEYFQDSNIVWLKHMGRLNNGFLKQFYSVVKWKGLEGTTIKRLYNKNILDTEIRVPCLDEQAAIGIFFRNIDNQITAQQAKLDGLKQLKSAYLQKMLV